MAIELKCEHGTDIYAGRCTACDKTREKEKAVKDAFEVISRAINGGYGDGVDILANELSNEHPTLAAQFAKAVGIGIVRRALYNPDWRPFETLLPEGKIRCQFRPDLPEHADHDGRTDCTTVIGGELMARQSYI